MPILVLVPLIVLGIVLLFPFVGCVGDDYQKGYDEGKKVGTDEGTKAGTEAGTQAGIQTGIDIGKKQQGDAETEEEESKKYYNVVLAEKDLISYWRLSEGEVGDLTAVDSA